MPALRELSPSQCERLLRRGAFGRVVMATSDGPEIVPVNYAISADTVVIRTSPTGLLARHADGRSIAFEVDLVDESRWIGWSVVAHGTGQILPDPDDRSPDRVRARTWADGDRSCELRLAWTRLTGRRVGDGWDLEGSMYTRRVQ
jgi:nitroimidazol reductase NimA-like FMN-containing flavoprotein (pyridoxamine 5'-phosphate oxidase superfamily)